jgi:hypothetical protein
VGCSTQIVGGRCEQGWKQIETALAHEAQRSHANQRFHVQVERLLRRFFSVGYLFSVGEYGGDDFNVVTLDIKDERGDDIDVPYDSIDAYGGRIKALEDKWWHAYSDATDRMWQPYSLIVSKRPVAFPLDIVHPESSRIGFRRAEGSGWLMREHDVLVVDLSGVEEELEQRRLIGLAKTLLIEYARRRFGTQAPSTSAAASESRATGKPHAATGRDEIGRPNRRASKPSPQRRKRT